MGREPVHAGRGWNWDGTHAGTTTRPDGTSGKMHRMPPNNTSTPSYSPLRFQATRWSIYAVLVVAYMSVYFHRMAPGVVSSELMVAFGTTGAALGSLAAMYYY